MLKAEKQRTTSVFVLPHRPEHTKFTIPMRKQLGFYWTFHQLRHTFACRWLNVSGSKEALRRSSATPPSA